MGQTVRAIARRAFVADACRMVSTRLSHLSPPLTTSSSHRGEAWCATKQVFVPTKIAKPVRLAPDRRAYDAQSLDQVPENPFEAEVRQSRARPKPTAQAGTMASELEELEAAMNSDLEDDEDWVLNDDFVHCALDTQVYPSRHATSDCHVASRRRTLVTLGDAAPGAHTRIRVSALRLAVWRLAVLPCLGGAGVLGVY